MGGGTLCLPWFKQIFPIEEGVTSLFYYFSGYIGYYLLGSYLTSMHHNFTRYSIVALLLAWGTPTMVKLLQLPIDFYQTFGISLCSVVAQCIFWMQLAHSPTICRNAATVSAHHRTTIPTHLWSLPGALVVDSSPSLSSFSNSVTENSFPTNSTLLQPSAAFLGSFLLSWLLYQFKMGTIHDW